MVASEVDRLHEVLWPGNAPRAETDIYALLDAARDPRIYPLIRRSGADHRCLFAGELAPELKAAAPYLVFLGKDATITEDLLWDGWGNAWGVFLESSAIIQDLRRHFRRLLTVQDERGKRLFFRFYDPRVLSVYLPTCTIEELRTVFGPVEAFFYERPGETGVTSCRPGRSGAATFDSHPLDQPAP